MTQPLTPADMRRLWRDGEPMASIAAKARLRHGLTKDEVRRIVFAEERIGQADFDRATSPPPPKGSHCE